MRVTVIGLGYVGLVTSACLAEWGHEVTGVEAHADRLARLKAGSIPFFEPGLDQLVTSNMEAGRIRFAGAEDTPKAVSSADIVITAVGTHDGNGGWQTATMLACLSQVVPHLRDDAVLVSRSTLPPDFIRQMPSLVTTLRQEAGRTPVAVLTNPEFTREGSAVRDFMQPDRVVFGVMDDPEGRGVALLRELYAAAEAPIVVLSGLDAAFAKLGANLFLATKISFANELATLCETYGANVDDVVGAMAYDPRIGGSFLKAGIGFGGSCLPHQVMMTIQAARALGAPTPLLSAVDHINHRQRVTFVDRLGEMVGGDLAGKRIALLGLTFKPQTDDLRDAPSLTIARLLVERGATPVAYDPMATARQNAAAAVPGLSVAASVDEAIAGADAIGLVTEWAEFCDIDWEKARDLVRLPVILDGRNALPADQLRAAGFVYASFGRGLYGATSDIDSAAAEVDGRTAAIGAPMAVVSDLIHRLADDGPRARESDAISRSA